MRYKGWTHHRDRVLERLGGWSLMAHGPDFATFSIPQVGVFPFRLRSPLQHIVCSQSASGGGLCPYHVICGRRRRPPFDH